MGNTSGSIALLQKSLDLVWCRQQMTLNNIANSDTPGYKSKSVEFETLLKSAMGGGAKTEKEMAERIRSVSPRIVKNSSTSARADGNNVDLDAENIELARTQLQYQYLANSLTSQINRLKYVINEGKR
jgi:flagellar basal-body rod protein FlgB